MELTLDIFKNDAFSAMSLQRVADNTPYIPSAIGASGLFESKPITTEEVILYEKDGGFALIPATERGAPWIQQVRREGRMFAIPTVALRKQDTVRAGELPNVANMALPESIRLRNAQQLTVERTSQLKTDLEATKELHRLGALQGKVVDADGSTVLIDYFAQFGIAAPVTINFNFGTIAEGQLGLFIQRNVRDPMLDTLRAAGRATPTTRIEALVDDEFWYGLITHIDVRKRWEAVEQARAVALATNPLLNLPRYDEITVGNVTFKHYQGSTGGEIDIQTNMAHFYPVGAKDVFAVYWAPGETMLDATQPGRPEYLYIQPDVRTQMPSFVDIFMAAYPAYACIFPKALMKGQKTG